MLGALTIERSLLLYDTEWQPGVIFLLKFGATFNLNHYFPTKNCFPRIIWFRRQKKNGKFKPIGLSEYQDEKQKTKR